MRIGRDLSRYDVTKSQPSANRSQARSILALYVLVLLPAAAEAKAPGKPNIVVIVSDDVGAGQPGFQGGAAGATPNLDRLANHGARFSQFYVHATCTPTRSAFLTGRYPFRTGTEERFHANDTAGMLTDERTLAEALHSAGYFTAIIGKWHLGAWHKQHLPLQRGFDHQYGCYGGVLDHFTRRRGDIYDWHRNEQPLYEEGYSTFLVANEFARLLDSHDTSQPFFFYVPFSATHGPHDAPEEFVTQYDGDRQLAMLACFDIAVGQIIESLKKKGVWKDTLIIYFNDNGAIKRVGNAPFRGVKKTTYEGGVRMPCFWHWPDKIPPGTVVHDLVHVTDFYPTLLTRANAALDQPLPLDGYDIWETIAHGKAAIRDEVVLSVPGLEAAQTGQPAIRVGDYKWVDGELFNLAADPYEQTDLAKQHPDIARRLESRLSELASERRPPEVHSKVPSGRPAILGKAENRHPPEWLSQQTPSSSSALNDDE